MDTYYFDMACKEFCQTMKMDSYNLSPSDQNRILNKFEEVKQLGYEIYKLKEVHMPS